MSSDSTRQQQQQEQLCTQILQQQQRQQLQLQQQQQYQHLVQQQKQQQLKRSAPSYDQYQHHHLALAHQAQQQQQARQLAKQQQHAQKQQQDPASATTITTLQDALSYPEQRPQLAPLPPKSSSKTTRPKSADSKTTSKSKSSKSVVAYANRKKFPPGLSRFRDRLQHLEERLTLDVNALKQEIRDLQLRRGLVETRTLTTRFSATGSAAKIICEYFTTFRQGFQSVPQMAGLHQSVYDPTNGGGVTLGLHQSLDPSSSSSSPTPLLLLQSPQLEATHRQSGFFSSLVDPRMEFRTFVGRDVLMEQWLRYSQCHAGLRMQLFSIHTTSISDDDVDMDSDGSAVVHARGKLTAYITMQTLEQIFPNVLQHSTLTQKLLGSYIEYALFIEFHVSPEGKITKYDPDVDFVGGLSRVLGNFEEVTLAMRDALISHFSMIGHLDGFQEVQTGVEQAPRVAVLETEPESVDFLESSKKKKRRSSRESATVGKSGSQHNAGSRQHRPRHAESQREANSDPGSSSPSSKSTIDYILT